MNFPLYVGDGKRGRSTLPMQFPVSQRTRLMSPELYLAGVKK